MTLTLSGVVSKKYEYSDYGERSLDSRAEILNNEFGYNGEAHTLDGLQYLRARYYDPKTMSFISADSYRGELDDPLSQNRYTYCHNNPYKYDDPSGHNPLDENVYDNPMMLGGGGLPSLVIQKKKEDEEESLDGKQSSRGSSAGSSPPESHSNYSSQVTMYGQEGGTVSIQSYDFDDEDPEPEEVVPSLMEMMLKERNKDFGKTAVTLDTPSNQKVSVEIKETEEVTGNIETGSVGVNSEVSGGETGTEPYYYSNPFGVN